MYIFQNLALLQQLLSLHTIGKNRSAFKGGFFHNEISLCHVVLEASHPAWHCLFCFRIAGCKGLAVLAEDQVVLLLGTRFVVSRGAWKHYFSVTTALGISQLAQPVVVLMRGSRSYSSRK